MGLDAGLAVRCEAAAVHAGRQRHAGHVGHGDVGGVDGALIEAGPAVADLCRWGGRGTEQRGVRSR